MDENDGFPGFEEVGGSSALEKRKKFSLSASFLQINSSVHRTKEGENIQGDIKEMHDQDFRAGDIIDPTRRHSSKEELGGGLSVKAQALSNGMSNPKCLTTIVNPPEPATKGFHIAQTTLNTRAEAVGHSSFLQTGEKSFDERAIHAALTTDAQHIFMDRSRDRRYRIHEVRGDDGKVRMVTEAIESSKNDVPTKDVLQLEALPAQVPHFEQEFPSSVMQQGETVIPVNKTYDSATVAAVAEEAARFALEALENTTFRKQPQAPVNAWLQTSSDLSEKVQDKTEKATSDTEKATHSFHPSVASKKSMHSKGGGKGDWKKSMYFGNPWSTGSGADEAYSTPPWKSDWSSFAKQEPHSVLEQVHARDDSAKKMGYLLVPIPQKYNIKRGIKPARGSKRQVSIYTLLKKVPESSLDLPGSADNSYVRACLWKLVS